MSSTVFALKRSYRLQSSVRSSVVTLLVPLAAPHTHARMLISTLKMRAGLKRLGCVCVCKQQKEVSVCTSAPLGLASVYFQQIVTATDTGFVQAITFRQTLFKELVSIRHASVLFVGPVCIFVCMPLR